MIRVQIQLRPTGLFCKICVLIEKENKQNRPGLAHFVKNKFLGFFKNVTFFINSNVDYF